MTLSVTRLAKSCNLSRSTVLYYESIGLLTRPRRSPGNHMRNSVAVFVDHQVTFDDVRRPRHFRIIIILEDHRHFVRLDAGPAVRKRHADTVISRRQ